MEMGKRSFWRNTALFIRKIFLLYLPCLQRLAWKVTRTSRSRCRSTAMFISDRASREDTAPYSDYLSMTLLPPAWLADIDQKKVDPYEKHPWMKKPGRCLSQEDTKPRVHNLSDIRKAKKLFLTSISSLFIFMIPHSGHRKYIGGSWGKLSTFGYTAGP